MLVAWPMAALTRGRAGARRMSFPLRCNGNWPRRIRCARACAGNAWCGSASHPSRRCARNLPAQNQSKVKIITSMNSGAWSSPLRITGSAGIAATAGAGIVRIRSWGSTGHRPVPPGDQPGGRVRAARGQAGLTPNQVTHSHSAGQVAQRDGLVARSTLYGRGERRRAATRLTSSSTITPDKITAPMIANSQCVGMRRMLIEL